MAATVQLSESNGAGETVTDDVARSDWLSADTVGDSDKRAANPIAQNSFSYEKYHRGKWASGTATSLGTWRHYYQNPTGYPGSPAWLVETSAQSGTPSNETYATPINTDSAKADTAFPSSDPAVATISGTLTASGQYTGYVVTQVDSALNTVGFSLDNVWAWAEVA